MIDRKWGEMILDGHKSIEVRHTKNEKHQNKRVGLCFNGTSRVYGYVTFIENIAFTSVSWEQERARHCCREGTVPYGGRAWGWVCEDPEWLAAPITIRRKRGAQIFQLVNL